jgi:hypothetical protein
MHYAEAFSDREIAEVLGEAGPEGASGGDAIGRRIEELKADIAELVNC